MMKILRVRVGGYIYLADEEAKTLLAEGGSDTLDKIIARNLRDGTFKQDGESYFPGESVDEFNRTYGTDYDTRF